MTEKQATLFARFIENRDVIKKTFPWESSYLYPIGASIFTDKGLTATPESLRTCLDLLKENTGYFSNFRGTGKLPILCVLATDENPQTRMKRSIKAHEALRAHFSASQFLPLAAVILSEVDEYRYDQIAARAHGLYKRMRKEHPWLTSAEDTVFAVLLAQSYKSDDQLLHETETCYNLLRKFFHSANAVQSLTHVLTLSEGTTEEKCRRFLDLWGKFSGYNPQYLLATLGVVALLDDEISVLHDELLTADRFLRGQKGYGFWGLGKDHRLLHAGMLVTSLHGANAQTVHATALNSALATVAAQQAAMCATIAAASSAAAASN